MSVTNFNQFPYFDDYDETKNYYRVLFKPGVAVQARELTQLQTILQKQIERLGQHVFKEGSLVLGGDFNLEDDIDYIKIKDLSANNSAFDINSLIGKTVTGQTNGIQAFVVNVADGVQTETDTKTLFVKYLTGADSISVFENDEVLVSESANVSALSTGSTGKGSIFSIEEGVFYSRGYFIFFAKQSVILERYDTLSTCKVGFLVNEQAVDFIEDPSLLDNAQGTPNFVAPGADRFKINSTLIKVNLDDPITLPEFVEMFSIKDGVVQQLFELPQYNIIQNELAKRTYDESGDYVVNGFDIRVREHLNTGSNEGVFSLQEGGNTELLIVGVEPGLAYVKGFEVNTLVTTNLETPKSLDTTFVNSQITPARIGNFAVIEQVSGSWILDKSTIVSLFDAAQTSITSKTWSTGSPTGNLIGSAKIKTVEYDSGNLGTPTGRLRAYLYDIQMAPNQIFSDAKSLFVNNGGGQANSVADIVTVDGQALLQENTLNTLLFPLGADSIKSLKNEQGVTDTTFTFKRTQIVTISAGGTFSTSLIISGEIFPYGSTLSDIGSDERRQIILTINEDKTVALTGTVAGTSGANTITGSGTSFTNLNIGDKIEIADVVGTFYIQTIQDNGTLTLTEDLPSTFTGKTYVKAYKVGDIIDLRSRGATTGTVRSVISASTSVLNFNLNESFASTVSASVSLKVSRIGALEIDKQLRPSRFVKFDCNTIFNTTGSLSNSFNLGFSDVIQIKRIKKDTEELTSIDDGVDVTNSFQFDDGQRDEFYDHATITPRIALTTSDHLLVELDYFEPDFSQGVGFFCVDSYPVNDSVETPTTIRTDQISVYRSKTTNTVYDLKNFLDFRPVKTNSANDATNPGSATINPSSSNGFVLESNGQRLPVPGSQIIVDFTHYLPRIDVIAVDKDSVFTVIRGTPSENPVPPPASDSYMVIGTVFITPYPSLSPSFARIVNRRDLGCAVKRSVYERFTMRQIGVLKQRVENLEYFASLNALEKAALDMVILDGDGLDRFKNGIFVDNFVDHSLGANYLPDYNIVIDKEEKSIRPTYRMDSFDYRYVSGTNVQKTGDLITLPYTEEVLLEQNNASTIRNIEQSVYRFNGRLYLKPDYDVWVDTEIVDRNITTGADLDSNADQGLNIEWNAWQNVITGYNLYNADTGKLLGTTKTLKDAQTNAQQIAGPVQVKRNTIGYKGPNVSVTVEAIGTKTRTGTENYSGILEDTQELGNFVTDVSIIPYIRPQSIYLEARGLKPTTRFFVFFDGERMSQYVSPVALQEEDGGFVEILGVEGSNLISDEEGYVRAYLRLPDTSEKRFRIGTKEIVVTDSPTNAPDATSSAEQYFVAKGLIQQKQNTILTTRQVVFKTRTVDEKANTRSGSIFKVNRRNASCLAYSFYVNVPETEQGIFLTSVDVFIAESHPTLGCWFEIREMDSGGGITRSQVPFSEVWLERDDPAYVITEDSTQPTKVTFPSPVFLENKTQYAFVVHTIGLNPDTYFWVSRLGENDVITNQAITSRPLTGTLFTTNNNLNYVPVLDVDLKIRFNRANFNTNVTGTALFGNEPIDFYNVSPDDEVNLRPGETVTGTSQLILSNILGGIITAGDKLVGQTSNAVANVVNIIGNNYFTDDRRFVRTETVNVTFANNTPRGITAEVNSVVEGSGTLYKYDEKDNKIYIKNTNGRFLSNDIIKGESSEETVTLQSLSSYQYGLVDFEPNFIPFNNTQISFDGRTTNNSNILDTNFFNLSVRNNNDFLEEKRLLSRNAELTLLSGQPSSQFRTRLVSQSRFISPVVDVSRTHSVYVLNLVNANTVGEEAPSGGNLINKYISKTVTLAPDQDAEDLVVFISTYRPAGTDVKVYCKLRNINDTDSFESKDYIEMERVTDDVFSSISSRDDFVSFDFKIPEALLTGSSDEVQYIKDGVTYTGFKQFAIKVGLLSENSAVVPRVADLRVIALQK